MSFKLFLEYEESIIPVGTILFHGSLEPFPARKLKPGGDRVLWFADKPAVAQAYIPRSGSSVVFSPSSLTRPTKDKQMQKIQKHIGIDYDVDDVEWDYMDRAKSFRWPKGWDHLPTEEEVAERIEKVGWKDMSGSKSAAFKRYQVLSGESIHDFLPPGQTMTGRLFVAKVMQPLKIYDISEGREGDLMNPDYHRYRMFERVEKEGYDGVKIHDFAQVHDWGNVGHESIGIFKNALTKLTWTSMPAKHVDWEHARANKYTTPEYEEYLKGKKNVR